MKLFRVSDGSYFVQAYILSHFNSFSSNLYTKLIKYSVGPMSLFLKNDTFESAHHFLSKIRYYYRFSTDDLWHLETYEIPFHNCATYVTSDVISHLTS